MGNTFRIVTRISTDEQEERLKSLQQNLANSEVTYPEVTDVPDEWEAEEVAGLDEPDDVEYEEVYRDADGNMVNADGTPLTAYDELEFDPEGNEVLL